MTPAGDGRINNDEPVLELSLAEGVFSGGTFSMSIHASTVPREVELPNVSRSKRSATLSVPSRPTPGAIARICTHGSGVCAEAGPGLPLAGPFPLCKGPLAWFLGCPNAWTPAHTQSSNASQHSFLK